jgi:serine/threonine protein kinase
MIPSTRGLDSYQILRQIASGPNGDVFKCRAPGTGELCVVKRTEAEKVDLRAQEHLASLSLPNIATPTRIWTEGDFVCEELPYIGGTRLSAAVPASVGGLRGALLTGFFSQMERALGALHAADLVHRDIHPDNIYLSVSEADAEPTAAERASDWESEKIGLSREDREAFQQLDDAAPLRRIVFVLVDCTFATHAGGVAEVTPVMHDSFTPLEQILGQPSAASDFYAFGATLFYLITGAEVPSYRDRTSETIRLHPVNTRTGQSFDGVLESLLSRDPSARRLDMFGLRSSMGPGDCGTLALSDGSFLIANTFDAYSRVVSRREALEMHNEGAAGSKSWLDSHQSYKDSTDDYGRRQYESDERRYAEHLYWVRTLSSLK